VQAAEKALQVLTREFIVEVDDVHCARKRLRFGRGRWGVDGHRSCTVTGYVEVWLESDGRKYDAVF
jgi:hypothetical protein